MYVSEEWLEDKKRNPIYGWQRKHAIISKPKDYKRLKVSDAVKHADIGTVVAK